MSLSLRLLVHASGVGDNNEPLPIRPNDQVEIRIQTIDCRDLKDVEFGFLGIKAADDQNDVYLKLSLGMWGEVGSPTMRALRHNIPLQHPVNTLLTYPLIQSNTLSTRTTDAF